MYAFSRRSSKTEGNLDGKLENTMVLVVTNVLPDSAYSYVRRLRGCKKRTAQPREYAILINVSMTNSQAKVARVDPGKLTCRCE